MQKIPKTIAVKAKTNNDVSLSRYLLPRDMDMNKRGVIVGKPNETIGMNN